jgi:hypothetical protein
MVKAKEEKISKTDTVRPSLADSLDNPTEAVAHIKKKFGIDITTQQFSTYKSNSKIKGAKHTKKTRKPPGVAIANGLIDVFDAAAAVKELCSQIGTDKVKKLVGLFE